MKIATMRWADRWLGVPACFALTAIRALTERFRRGKPGPAKTILFVKLAEQGSTVLAYPAIARAVERVGRKNVYFMVFRDNRFILDALDAIEPENVLEIDAGSLLSAVRGAVRAIRRARAAGVDAAIDMEFFARSSAALCYLSGAAVRIGFHPWGGAGPWRGNLMTHRLAYNSHLHTSRMFLAMVSALDAPAERFPAFALAAPAADAALPQFIPRPEEIEEVRAIVSRAAGRNDVGRLILLNPNAGDLLPLRRWPAGRYAELARRLLDKYADVLIVLTGAPGEAPLTEALARQVGSGRCLCLAGKTTLRQLLVLYGLAEVLVTNDSGPAHFAALTRTPTVVLFGPETPALYAPLSPLSCTVWAGLACSPCVSAAGGRRSACRDNLCMQRITVDEVFAQVCRLYEARLGGPAALPPASEPAQ